MQSTIDLGTDANSKLDNLNQKIDEVCLKLSSLDTLAEKINRFEKTIQVLVKNSEKVTKRVDDIEKKNGFH